MDTKSKIDITPSPRILKTLGEIPFHAWQCIAELIDNSLDAFAKNPKHPGEKRIIVSWSSPRVPIDERVFDVQDTGPGMNITTLQNCVRAGYSSNDPIDNLGLFGMGFNISTARLGDKTSVLSATKDAENWEGVEIDFKELSSTGSFSVPQIAALKQKKDETGTRIVVTRLNRGMFDDLTKNEIAIRRTLEDIYSPILREGKVEIIVQGKQLFPRQHCVWSPDRSVTRNRERVPAVIAIDNSFGEAYFDLERNCYLSPHEEAELEVNIQKGLKAPSSVVKRKKRVHGWIGIQRYADPNDFGIDFIRNGRKILIRNKSLFSYENPLTGTAELEYPLDLGVTNGGRIIGEIYVDYMKPTYQKNDFDRSDTSWHELVSFLRGSGPLLPRRRKALGLDETSSILGKLVNAYRRTDPGTRNLSAPIKLSREWGERFRKGEKEFENDEKWWKAAQEADRDNADFGASSAPIVDNGTLGTDDIDQFSPEQSAEDKPQVETSSTKTTPITKPVPKTSTLEELLSKSEKIEVYSKTISYSSRSPVFELKTFAMNRGERIFKNGVEVPFTFLTDGMENAFFFDPFHIVMQSYPLSFRDFVAVYLAERFKARDALTDIMEAFLPLIRELSSDSMIDKIQLQERSRSFFDRMREASLDLLKNREREVIELIHESAGEVEETVAELFSNADLMARFQKAEIGSLQALTVVPARTLVRIVDKFPEEWFDGKFFKDVYLGIQLPDDKATKRLRDQAKDRVLSFVKDALWILETGQRALSKDELARCSHSLKFLL